MFSWCEGVIYTQQVFYWCVREPRTHNRCLADIWVMYTWVQLTCVSCSYNRCCLPCMWGSHVHTVVSHRREWCILGNGLPGMRRSLVHTADVYHTYQQHAFIQMLFARHVSASCAYMCFDPYEQHMDLCYQSCSAVLLALSGVGKPLAHLTPAIHDCSPLPDQLCRTVCGKRTPTAGNISDISFYRIEWLETFR